VPNRVLVSSKLGRLELKPSRSHKSRFKHVDSCFPFALFKDKSLGVFHLFKYLFTTSFHMNFGLSLSLFPLLSHFRILLRIGVFRGLCWTCPNYLNRCWPSFSSIGAIPSLLLARKSVIQTLGRERASDIVGRRDARAVYCQACPECYRTDAFIGVAGVR
jgi:hypothetical protein